MRGLSFAALLLVLATSAAAAQKPANRYAAVDGVVARHVNGKGPGCAVGIVRRGELVYARGYGLADVEKGTAFTAQTVFGSGSIYKGFVAAGVLLLERQGKLSLDDDIRKFIPEIPDYGARITVRQLLDHTHGLREYLPLLALTSARADTPAELLRLLSRQRAPSAAPGARHLYGNTGPVLARLLVARVSGQPLGDFLRQHLFVPLDMRSTYVGDETRPVPLRAMGYRLGPDGKLAPIVSGGRNETSLEDLARWARTIDRPASRWKDVVEEMRTPSVLSNGEPIDYGLGLRLSPYRGLERVWHPGLASGGVAAIMHFPAPRLAILLGCNNQTLEVIRIAESIADVVLRDELARAERRRGTPSSSPSPVALPATELARLAGTYLSDTGSMLVITLRDGRLYARSVGGSRRRENEPETPEHEMVPVSPTRFLFPGAPKLPLDPAFEAVFDHRGDGGRMAVEVRTDWTPIRFTAIDAAASDATVPRDAVGTYRNEDTESTLIVLEREGRFELQTPHERLELVPAARDLFRAGRFFIRFTDGALDVTTGSVSGLRFARTE